MNEQEKKAKDFLTLHHAAEKAKTPMSLKAKSDGVLTFADPI